MDDILLHRAIPTLRVADTALALSMYSALGFTVAWEHQLLPEAPRLLCIRQDTVELFLTEHDVTQPKSVVYIMTRGLNALVTRAAKSGVHPSFGPEDQPWGNREAYFRDRDGNVLRFGEAIG